MLSRHIRGPAMLSLLWILGVYDRRNGIWLEVGEGFVLEGLRIDGDDEFQFSRLHRYSANTRRNIPI